MLSRAGAYITTGLIVGLAAAWMFAGSLEAFLFDVRGRDLTVFVGATLVLGVIGLVAAAVPALRASRVDPVTALRCD